MKAIIEYKGRQFRVSEGETIDVPLSADAPGALLEFDRVLLLGDGADAKIGTPVVAGAKVTGEVQKTVFGDKLTVFKFKKRKGEKCKNGHRQRCLRVLIREVKG